MTDTKNTAPVASTAVHSIKGKITNETARRITYAYAEIEAANKLLTEIIDGAKKQEAPDFRDAFGRRRELQLGVPSGESSHRLFRVDFSLARIVIEAHVKDQETQLDALCQLALRELHGDGT